MSIIFGIILLAAIWLLYKLFIDGWLWKVCLFFGGWFGIYLACRIYVDGAMTKAITIGSDNPVAFSWAAVIPTFICLMALLYTKVYND